MHYLIDFCRFCLSFEGDFTNMSTGDIIEKANACIGELEFYFNVPNLICNKCLETLDMFFNFRNQCLRSELVLHRYIQILMQEKSTENFINTKLAVMTSNNYRKCNNLENMHGVIRKAFSNETRKKKITNNINQVLTFSDFNDLERLEELEITVSQSLLHSLGTAATELQSNNYLKPDDLNYPVINEVVLNTKVLSPEISKEATEKVKLRNYEEQKFQTFQDNFIESTNPSNSHNLLYKALINNDTEAKKVPSNMKSYMNKHKGKESNKIESLCVNKYGQTPEITTGISTETDYENNIACHHISNACHHISNEHEIKSCISNESGQKYCISNERPIKSHIYNEPATKSCISNEPETNHICNEPRMKYLISNEHPIKPCITNEPGTKYCLSNEPHTKHISNDPRAKYPISKELETKHHISNEPEAKLCVYEPATKKKKKQNKSYVQPTPTNISNKYEVKLVPLNTTVGINQNIIALLTNAKLTKGVNVSTPSRKSNTCRKNSVIMIRKEHNYCTTLNRKSSNVNSESSISTPPNMQQNVLVNSSKPANVAQPQLVYAQGKYWHLMSNGTLTLPPIGSNNTATGPPPLHPYNTSDGVSPSVYLKQKDATNSNNTTTSPPTLHPFNKSDGCPPLVYPQEKDATNSNNRATSPPTLHHFNKSDGVPPLVCLKQNDEERTTVTVKNEIDVDYSYRGFDEKLNVLNETISMDTSFPFNTNCDSSEDFINALDNFFKGCN